MTKRMQKVFLFLLFLAAAGTAEGQVLSQQFDGGRVYYNAPDRILAEQVIQVYPECLAEVNQVLGRQYSQPVNIYLYRSGGGFKELGIEGLDALAYARRSAFNPDSLVIIVENFRRSDSSLRSLLMHEVTHIVVGEAVAIGSGALPRWFDEGVAEWTAERGLEWDGFSRADLSRHIMPLSDLESEFPKEREAQDWAYQESRSVVAFIADRYGEEAIRKIIANIDSGEEFPDAFRQASGVTVSEMEEQWQKHIQTSTIGDILATYGGLAVSVLTAGVIVAATIVSIRKMRRRRREILEELDAEESSRIAALDNPSGRLHGDPLLPPAGSSPDSEDRS